MARFEMTYRRPIETVVWEGRRSITYLVRVHVTLSATAGLKHYERELVDQLARDDLHTKRSVGLLHARSICTHFVRSLLDGLANLWIHAVANIHDGSRLLEYTKRLDDGLGQALRGATDVEVLQRPLRQHVDRSSNLEECSRCGVPLCLRSPVAVCGNLELTEGVALNSVLPLLHSAEQ